MSFFLLLGMLIISVVVGLLTSPFTGVMSFLLLIIINFIHNLYEGGHL